MVFSHPLFFGVLAFLTFAVPGTPAAPSLKLPFRSGETWQLTRGYNFETHQNYGPWYDDRYALDFAQAGCESWRKPILAAADGVVYFTGDDDGWGQTVIIDHGDGYRSRYSHLDYNSIIVTEGQAVLQGQEIGLCGNSGNTTGTACPDHRGTHLHFALYHNGVAELPEPMSGWTDFTPTQWYTSDNMSPHAAFFADDFETSMVDALKWNTSIAIVGSRWSPDILDNQHSGPGNWQDVSTDPSHGVTQEPPYGAVTVSGGQASFGADFIRAFPYIWSGPPSRPSPFPSGGDFVLEVRMKFDSFAPHGSGIHVVSWENSDPVGDNQPNGQNFVFGIWGDTGIGLRVTVFGEQVILPDPLAYHEYELEFSAGEYSLYVDGVLTVPGTASNLRPNAIWIGNPVFTYWGVADWSDFTLDFVRVSIPNGYATWADFGYAGVEFGTSFFPFNTLGEGVDFADEGGTIKIRGDTGTPSSPETLTIVRNVRIESVGGPVRIGSGAAPAVPAGVYQDAANRTLRTSGDAEILNSALNWILYE
jgi:hypothetical protein